MGKQNRHTRHLTREQIQRYLNGELSAREMHEIERVLVDSDFYADAAEGFELSQKAGVQTDRVLAELRHRLNDKIKDRQKSKLLTWPAWSAAAGIALAVAAYVLIRYVEHENRIKANHAAIQGILTDIQDTDKGDTLLVAVPEQEEYVVSLAAAEAPAGRASQLLRDFPSQAPQNDQVRIRGIKRPPVNEEPVPDSSGAALAEITTDSRAKLPAREAEKLSAARAASDDTAFGRVITGKIVGENGQPLPGASIQVEGTDKGTSTDREGKFMLAVPENENKLLASFLGYEHEKIFLNDTTSVVALRMRPNEESLNEVAVVGFGGKGGKLRAASAVDRAGYKKYLVDSLRYPTRALENKTEGKVVLSFRVDENGRPAVIRVEKSLGDGCDQEAVRLIRQGPDLQIPEDNSRVKQSVVFKLPQEE